MLRRTSLTWAGLLVIGLFAAPAHGKRIDDAAFADACVGEAGYPAFRGELRNVVAARDGDGLRALFHPQGAMRVNSVGGHGNTPDWGFSRPEAKVVWSELKAILSLGCARRGEKLVLPAMALADDLQDGEVVVLHEEAIRREPREAAKAVRRVKRGQVLWYSEHAAPNGWTAVRVDGRVGYLPTASLRTPFAVRLELVPYEDGWRIRSFGDGV